MRAREKKPEKFLSPFLLEQQNSQRELYSLNVRFSERLSLGKFYDRIGKNEKFN